MEGRRPPYPRRNARCQQKKSQKTAANFSFMSAKVIISGKYFIILFQNDTERQLGLERGRDQRPAGHDRTFLDARHHHS